MRAVRTTTFVVALFTGFAMNVGWAQADPPPTPVKGLPGLTAPMVSSLAKNTDQKVIVIMKNQHLNVPATRKNASARAGLVAADQSPVIADLKHTGAKKIRSTKLISSVSATVSAGEAKRLAADPNVAEVVPDLKISIPAPVTVKAPTTEPSCQPGSDGVELDPEALSVIHANSTNPNDQTASKLGVTGKGVTVAYMAESIDPNNPGFVRADGSHVFTDYKDFTGEGANTDVSGGEAILDASSIAAQGNQVFSIPGCKFRVEGVAPGASIVGLKVFPTGDLVASTSGLLEAIEYAVTVDHVDILNQSFGYNPLPDTSADLIRQADQAAIEAGTTVVVSTGDAGPTNTIGSPSADPGVISAAATTTFRTYAQAGIAHYSGIKATGWVNNNISALSSGGITEGTKSPDLAAPGDLNWVLNNSTKGVYNAGISGGTSEAAPLTAGTAALVIQAYRQTHGGASPTPALIKQILTSTTDDLGHPGSQQGAGLVNSYKAVQAAMSVKTSAGAPKPTGSTLLTSVSQLNAAGAPGRNQRFRFGVANTGQSTQTVKLAGRTLGAYHQVSSTKVTLGSSVGEHFSAVNAQKVTFKVAPGASRLQADIAAPTNDSSLSVTLLDPLGQLEAYSLPQGSGNHGAVDVRNPAFGTWTAFITDKPAAAGGYEGPVRFQASTATYQSFGRVSPSSITLAPGASRTVTVATRTPSSPGDLSAALVLNAPFGRRTSVPINLRSLVPLRGGAGTFSTPVTGGNGRGGSPAVTRYYQFDVRAGQKALDVQTTVSKRAVDNYNLYLVDPSGETVGHASNQLVVGTKPSGPVTVLERGARSHVLNPARGRWTLVAAFANPVAGTALSTTFTGTVRLAPFVPVFSGLPNSSKTTLVAGKTHVAKVTVRNDGSAAETYFVDPRLNSKTTIALPSFTPSSNLTLPFAPASAATPQWIVPTETSSLDAAAEATAPVTFDWAPYLGNLGGDLNGDPDLGATNSGNTASGHWAGSPVTPGDWLISPALVGPFTAPAPRATVNLAMSATTKAFDAAASSTTGDFWATEAGKGGRFTPVIVQPGQSTTIYVTITPSGKPGQVVKGTLYVDDASSLSTFGEAVPSGEELAAIPYTYRVG